MTRLPVAIASAFGGVAALSALLRTVNTLIEGHFVWDDACALVAGICSILINVLILRMASAGQGRNMWTLPFGNVSLIMKASH
jgi:divalent metal cation (Fe/Co/Zn/Cd) transporter